MLLKNNEIRSKFNLFILSKESNMHHAWYRQLLSGNSLMRNSGMLQEPEKDYECYQHEFL